MSNCFYSRKPSMWDEIFYNAVVTYWSGKVANILESFGISSTARIIVNSLPQLEPASVLSEDSPLIRSVFHLDFSFHQQSSTVYTTSRGASRPETTQKAWLFTPTSLALATSARPPLLCPFSKLFSPRPTSWVSKGRLYFQPISPFFQRNMF